MYILKIPPHTVYDPLTYLKSYKKFYENVSTAKRLSSGDMFKFSNIVKIQGQSKSVIGKICFW